MRERENSFFLYRCSLFQNINEKDIIFKVMRCFQFTAFGHFIGFVCHPCQNYLHFRHCCSNCCLQIFVTLRVVHCRCIAYLDLYFRCHDHHLMVVSLLDFVRLNMVMLISFVYHPGSLLYILIVHSNVWIRKYKMFLVFVIFFLFSFHLFYLKKYYFHYNLCNKLCQ